MYPKTTQELSKTIKITKTNPNLIRLTHQDSKIPHSTGSLQRDQVLDLTANSSSQREKYTYFAVAVILFMALLVRAATHQYFECPIKNNLQIFFFNNLI